MSESGQFKQCQRCGECCRLEGQVRLSQADIARLAMFLEVSEAEFIERYTQLARDRRGLVLTEHPDGSCVFLENNECRVNPVKPTQCAEFPATWNNPGWEAWCEGASGAVEG